MQSRYGWDKNQIILYKHLVDGSKKIKDLQPYFEGNFDLEWSTLYRKMIFHDQEPFSKDYLDTYQQYRLEANNNEAAWKVIQPEDFVLFHFRTCSWPIFCHSEKNSTDIEWLESLGFITCHYLWHGLISRDWFRHWKHHPHLTCVNNDWQKRFLLYARGKDGSRKYRLDVLESLSKIKDDVLYDWDETNLVPSHFSATIDTRDARLSAIHLVSETVFDQDKIHATEKVFKPMVMRQPFIVFAGSGMLQYLKDYGFKTFDSVWDESYDKEMDHKKRLGSIMDLIFQLNSLPESEFRLMLSKCQSILDHNRQHFFSEKFESIMLDELHHNVTDGIEKQKNLCDTDPGGSFFFLLNKLRMEGTPYTSGMNKILDYYRTVRDPHMISYLQRVSKQYPWFCR